MHNRVMNNAGWLIGSRIIQSLLGFVISMLTARYLGPSNYGLINYASSLVAFVTPIMTLGINAVLVKEIISNPDNEGEILGTTLILNVASALLCIIGLACFVLISNQGEIETLIVCMLYSLTLIAQAVEMIQYWFQAKLLSKYTALVGICAYLVVSIYKVFLLVTQKSVYWFAVSNSIDYAIIAFALIITYYKMGNQRFSFSKKRAKQLYSISKYYIISNMMITIFSQTDRIMLKNMVDDAETGYYSAAVTCASLTNFVFAAVIDSMRPIIFEGKEENNEAFELNLKRLYSIIIYMSLLQSVGIAILANIIVRIIYGEAYLPAVGILRVIVWYTTFSYIGAVRDIWIMAENKQKILWKINLFGALVNVVLNLCFIPIWGGTGAALASLITQIFTNVILGYIIKSIRKNNRLMLDSLNPKYLKRMVKIVLRKSN